jgi:phosphate transport system permease protein
VSQTDQLNALGTGTARERRSRLADRGFRTSTLVIGVGLIVLLAFLLVKLTVGAWPTFQRWGFGFFTGTTWNPVSGREVYGALPFIFGTLVTSLIAIVLAVPVAVGLALLLNQVPMRIANPLAVFVDILAAIPSIVYGLWALFVLKPVLDSTVEPFLTATLGKVPVIGALFQGKPQGPDLLTAGVVLAVMIVPIVTAVTREVVAVVPRDLREASLALGSTRYESVKLAVLPYARPGIVGATMIGLGRALGETIAVALVVGNTPKIGWSVLGPAATIPSKIASSIREASGVGPTRSALLALAVTLMIVSFLLALLSRLFVRKTAMLVAGPTAEAAATEPALRISG